MNRSILNTLTIALFLCHACNQKPIVTKTSSPEGNSLAINKKTLIESFEACDIQTENCTYIEINYPELVGKNAEKINELVKSEIFNFYFSDAEIVGAFDASMINFLRNYQEFKDDFPDSDQIWNKEINYEIVNQTDDLLSLKVQSNEYTGGAHPNNLVNFLNIDLEDGEKINLDNIISKDYRSKLDQLVDQKYRSQNNLTAQDNLKEKKGLFEEKINASENFAITDDGILFYYNNYEIGPYSMGPTEILLSNTELDGLLKMK
ncbi:DUF3298 and DUF4163 domain-containing protein [Flexithrix dorotheae]|uniref:DUF3298 and DUF4163 domain-containing protein n=1 Tax=Flexithrix dorotheae TaxID=70993 RepID=UPI00036E20B3|nr:DUF3298 and DUF4163 domain-containing protein [Flexithrix dorotheae]